ncbi:pyrimidine reductase family protein [Corynebacterium sp.]|uniref:pyrimidine reductase family protein n=1 Tax=Corynebacterium sp. TaxID=1720 RepID=UPI0026E10F07|nr:pyrimidine reductase family protein [Corynebacterium sp.]MDO5511996.1 pyrimidine reductase family protein [Corynebacterium sp.]
MMPGAEESFLTPLIGPVWEVGVAECRAMAISTLSGSGAVNGSSRSLGNDTDHALLNALRDWADVVVVGGRTAVAENYFGVRTTDATAYRRRDRGQSAVAPVAVVTRTLDLDPSSQLFWNTATAPLILAPADALADAALAARRQALTAAGAEWVSTGSGTAAEIMGALHARGLFRVLCEGGPSLYSMMFSADAVDVLHLTVDPLLQVPVEKPLFDATHTISTRLHLEHHAASDDGTLFLRYRAVR